MAEALVAQSVVETALLRPLTDTEAGFIDGLCDQASAKLRVRLRTVDSRIAAYTLDPDDPLGIDPLAVSAMLADVIKRRLDNPKGLWSSSWGDGPFTGSETYPGARSGDGAQASSGLVITDADLAEILPTVLALPRTIRLRPGLAPHVRGCR